MSKEFNTSKISGTGELVDKIKSKLDNFIAVLVYYNTILTDIGIQNNFELGNSIVSDLYKIIDDIDIMTKKLESIQFGGNPSPPCYEGSTGPDGWETCGTGISWN